MVEKSVIIIGAGIAGLSTGCYARMNGYHTRIFEMHDNPGGLCTAWQRKGYTVDGCLHWLMNSSPGSEMYRLWEELGVVQGQQIINMEQFYRVEGADGKVLTLYCDIDRLEQHMKKVAPGDTRLISDCARAIRRFTRMNLPVLKAQELYSPLDGLKLMFKMLPFMGDLRRWGRISMKELALRFRNPLLRDAWLNMWPPEFTALFMLITLATFHQKASGYPIGGSMQVSRAIEKRYLGLGGEIKYKSKVDKIIVENDSAVGVRLADGGEHRADYVISAADGHATIFDMLGGKYINDKIRGYYESLPIFPPLVFVSLGVNRSFEELPKMISGLVLTLEKPVTIGGGERKWLYVRIHNFDPTLAPPGKTLLTMMMESNYPYWEALHKDMARYRAEKEQIADTVVSLLDKRFPGLAAQVEMRDIATPVTFHRYTGNWQGSFEGWLVTPKTLMLNMSKTLPGLDCFYMAGQWVAPGGGLPSGAMTGRYVTQMLCKRDKKRFAATAP